MGVHQADDRKDEEPVPDLKRRCRQFPNGFLLAGDGRLTLRDHGVHDQGDIEEGYLLERGQVFEPCLGVLGELLHDPTANRSHQAVVGAQEDPHVQVGAVVELADLKALIQIGSPVAPEHHLHQMFPLEPPDLFKEARHQEQAPRLVDLREIVEERVDVLVQVIQHRILDRRDAGDIRQPEVDEGMSAPDVLVGQVDDARAELLFRHGVLPGLAPGSDRSIFASVRDRTNRGRDESIQMRPIIDARDVRNGDLHFCFDRCDI